MPKRTDIKSILLIGSGPIVIEQACELDYCTHPGMQALLDEDYRATLITDTQTATPLSQLSNGPLRLG